MAKLVLREGAFDDWYVIEREGGGRISDADVEGSADQMRMIAKAIRARGRESFKRCRVDATGDPIRFDSPRNSQRRGTCSPVEADDLATSIETTLALTTSEPSPPMTPTPAAPGEVKCDVCGWPLAGSEAHGCVPGNCSMRPKPVPHVPVSPSFAWTPSVLAAVEMVRDADRKHALGRPTAMAPSEAGSLAARRALATFDEHVTENETACASARLALADIVLAACSVKP